METRGPWTAKPALIKVDEIRNIKKCTCKKYSKLVQFSEKRHSVSYTVVKTATHKALFLATYRITATLLQAQRYEVSNDTAKVWFKSVVMANTAAKGCRTQYFLLAPIY